VRILVTNDDGVEAPGLRALTAGLAGAGHDVVVVAPSGECSGSGAAIGRLHRAGPIACTQVTWTELPGVAVYALDALPAATVYAGLVGTFGPRPDLVASGINPGLNSGHLVLHSGTVGAALTAATLGVPGVAVSLAWGEVQHWGTATNVAVATVRAMADVLAAEPDGPPPVLSVGVPNVVLDELRGVKDADLAPYLETWSGELRPGEVCLEYLGHGRDPDPGTDVACVRAGWAAITPLVPPRAAAAMGLADLITAALSSLHSAA
jgi:5'-nucleotidase